MRQAATRGTSGQDGQGPEQQLKAQLAAAQQAAATAQQAAGGTQPTAFNRVVELLPTDLPPPVLPTEVAAHKACGVLYLALEYWAAAGGNLPLSWADLQARATTEVGAAAGGESLKLAKTFLGPAWGKIFGATDPQVDDIVPRQAVQFLYTQLGHLKAQWESGQAMRVDAESAFAALKEGAKRHRTG